ncbi:hypothetical protein ANO14919_138230 [Xylariales sp. No.14919]|nr:hypothetical protein ANO14919_138230 [Xylariales sp. No.14919]
MPLYLKGVHLSEFPLTFQETIITVRRLGVRYLWIDCYCIIQGSDTEAKADWAHQSRLMGKIYANSCLNIGALESTDPSQGLFRYRPLDATNGKISWSPTRQQNRGGFTFFIQLLRVYDENIAFREMHRSALMHRAWVIQECVMAPRMLCFGKGDILWQCSERAMIDGPPTSLKNTTIRWTNKYPFWLLHSSDTNKHPHITDINHSWIETLGIYLSSHLTYPEKDLFAALDGVGTELQRLSGSVYKYGMLASTLPEALLYTTDDYGKPDQRDSTRPTWHWSSCYPKARVETIGDLYGRLSVGPVCRLAYAFMSEDCKPFPNTWSKDYWPHIFLIGRLMTDKPPAERQYDISDLENDGGYGQEIVYLPLVAQADFLNRRLLTYYGLILTKSKSGFYRRLGIWEASPYFPKRTGFDDQFTKTRPQLIVLE